MADAYQYFSGLPPLTGNQKSKTDYKGNVVRAPPAVAKPSMRCPAMRSRASTPRPTPARSRGQLRRQLHHLHQQRPVQDNTADNTNGHRLADDRRRCRRRRRRDDPDSDLAQGSADQRGRRMGALHEEQPAVITTYTIDVKPKITGQTPGWTALLKSMADSSGGKYFDGGSGQRRREIRKALGVDLLRDPGRQQRVRVGQLARQRQHRRHVPEPGLHRHVPARPEGAAALVGNLKQYKLGLVDDALRTLDADDAARDQQLHRASSPNARAASGRRPC